jgi:hypothetical protein
MEDASQCDDAPNVQEAMEHESKLTMCLNNLVNNPIVQGDQALINEIMQACKNKDEDPHEDEDYIYDEDVIEYEDPTLLFFWDAEQLTVFLQKVALLPANAPPPPTEFVATVRAGMSPIGDYSSEKLLASAILEHVENLVEGITRFCGNKRAGFVCTMVATGQAASTMALLTQDPWFAAVLAAGPPLGGGLANVAYASASEVGDRVLSGPLWFSADDDMQESFRLQCTVTE